MKHLNTLLAFCFLNANTLFAQDSSVKNTIGTFQEYADNYPVEKIYLHLDKPYYAAGEYMYLRAYLTDMHLNQENVESRIIYIELSDAKRNLVNRTLLYSEENEYAGQILLQDSLPSADYHLRAYTNWMRNSGEDHFYHRDIYIGNISKQPQKSLSKRSDFQVSFFPEGGNLLAGFSNRVAFKALENDGFGTDITGVLSDSEGNELLHFNSLQFGMGSFEFTPEMGKTYRATVESNGLQKEYILPISVEGLTMSVKQDDQSIYISLRSTTNEPEMIYLVGQSRHTVCHALEGIMEGNEQLYKVDNNKFPTGIAQFTLFKDGRPVSERLVFIDRKDDLHIDMIPDKEKYGDREKATVKIQVTDSDGEPVEGSFSLSVTDDKTVIPSINEQNIKGSLLLDSDLKGYIESPGWYFAGDEPERALALNNLLCTQGWSRFVWDKLADSSNYIYPVESEFHLSGKITNLVGLPVKDASVTLISNENQPGTTTTDKDGRFSFIGFNCPDTAIFVLQCRTKNDGRTLIGFNFDKLDNLHVKTNVLPLLKTENIRNKTLIEAYTEQAIRQKNIEEGSWMIDLPEISIKAKRTPTFESVGLFSIRVNKKILGVSYPIVQVMRSLRVPGIGRRPSLFIVDGVEIKREDFFLEYGNIPAERFEMLEILRPEDSFALYGPRASNGAYVFYSKRYLGDSAIPDASVEVYQPEGYCVLKEFYVPAYNLPEVKQRQTPDLRTTIYWNPVIRTNSSGEAEVSFYTADNTLSYSYILEGMGENNIAFTIR